MRLVRLLCFLALPATACVAPPPNGVRTSDPWEVLILSAQTVAAYPEMAVPRSPQQIKARKQQVAPKGQEVVPEGLLPADAFPVEPLSRYSDGLPQ